MKEFGPNGAYSSFHSSPIGVKGKKEPSEMHATSIEQAFIKIKKYDTLESNSLSLMESPLWAQHTFGVGEYASVEWSRVEKRNGVAT